LDDLTLGGLARLARCLVISRVLIHASVTVIIDGIVTGRG
jgi:hypothetical protein